MIGDVGERSGGGGRTSSIGGFLGRARTRRGGRGGAMPSCTFGLGVLSDALDLLLKGLAYPHWGHVGPQRVDCVELPVLLSNTSGGVSDESDSSSSLAFCTSAMTGISGLALTRRSRVHRPESARPLHLASQRSFSLQDTYTST